MAMSEIKGTEEVIIKNEDEKTVSIMKKSVYWCLDPNA
jgi:NACalpha-BTF3-like transcription factor